MRVAQNAALMKYWFAYERTVFLYPLSSKMYEND